MGKKKGNKTETNGEVEDDMMNDVENAAPADTGKKGKKSKKKNADWEDDIAKELEELTLIQSGVKKEEEEPAKPEPKKEKVKQKSKKAKDDSDDEIVPTKSRVGGGFAALMDDNSDGDDYEEEEEKPKKTKKEKNKKKKEVVEEDFEEEEPKKTKKEKNKKKEVVDDDFEEEETKKSKKDKNKKKEVVEEDPAETKKGKKGKKAKKGAADDDDIDALLAEIESEYKGDKSKDAEVETGKKGKKKKEKEVVEEDDEMEVETEKKSKKKKEPVIVSRVVEAEPEDEAEGASKGKKKKKKNKEGDAAAEEAEEKTKSRKGKPNAKMLEAMKEALAKKKEEEERLQREEEARIREEEERIKKIEEEQRKEQEKKDKRKQKEKERRERLKKEGKWLTDKQKADQKRAQQMLEHLKAMGMQVPGSGGPKVKRDITRTPKPKKPKKDEEKLKEEEGEEKPEEEKKEGEMEVDESKEEKDEVQDTWDQDEEDEVADDWDELSVSEDEDEEDNSEATKASQDTDTKKDDDDDDDEDSEESESEESEDEHQTEAEKRRARALARVAKRKEGYEKNMDPNVLRAPVVCVLGHVDHGKTKILDKLRKTNVQEGEVGGITQQIGATNVPAEAIRKQTHMIKDFNMDDLNFPGLLIIDTPGHESFSNLRSRGSSLCDIAILVVDVTQGLEPQTIESINLLKKRKTPFIVALNKVDRVFEWESQPSKDIREILKQQSVATKNDFERRTQAVMQALNIQGLNAALFWENPDVRSYVSLVPTSAISGDGMGNLIALVCDLCQKRLNKRLIFTEELQCTVLEVKTIQGHGTTIDIILINGRLREGDTIVLAGTEGPIVTQIRSLLLPKPLKEIRVKGQYDEFKEISAAQGVKVAAKELEKAIAGLNLQVSYHEDETDLIKEEVDKEFKMAMRSMKVKERGVYVQASTLGALEALLEFFKTNNVPYSGIRVGPVVKRDVMKAAAMLEHDPMYAVILAFDVKVERDAQDLADREGVKIFSEETIYHLGDRYVEYIKDYRKKQQEEFKLIAVFPSRLKIIPTAIFNKRDPIVLGVSVEAGVLRTGTPLCVPSKEFVDIGIVTSMEFDHKNVDIAKKGVDVCIKIEPLPGHTPKLIGRHFEAEDMLVSKISRESINACKDYFRDELSKTDWRLMAELKKEFQIL